MTVLYVLARQFVCARNFKPWSYGMTHVPMTGARGVNTVGTVQLLTTFDHSARGHMALIRPGARRLGAGVPLTVLQFAPLAQLHLVLGFHTTYCM
jgi:hypothetical protein